MNGSLKWKNINFGVLYLRRNGKVNKMENVEPEEVGMSSTKLLEVKKYLKWSMKTLKAASAAAAVILRHGKIVAEWYLGRYNHCPHARLVDENSQFKIYSVRKAYVATALCMLLGEGKVKLEDPLFEYFPELTDERGKITVRQIATHTSGLDPDAKHWKTVKLLHKPGSFHEYNNIGVLLVTDLIHRVSGKPLHEFMEERVFKPLGLKRTYWPLYPDEPPGDRVYVVRSETDCPGTLECVYYPVRPTAYSSLYTTARELARFGQMWLNGGELDGNRILTPQVVRLATTPQIPYPARRDAPYQGILWFLRVGSPSENLCPVIGDKVPVGSYAHGGASHCYLLVCPRLDLVAVKMLNRCHGPPEFDSDLDYRTFGDLVVSAVTDVEVK